MFGISHQRREEFDRAALVHIPELLRVASRLWAAPTQAKTCCRKRICRPGGRSIASKGTNCRAWLYKILLFTYSAQNRKRARQPFLVDLDAAGETALLVDAPTPDTLAAEAVKAAFDRLPENFRTLVVLVDVEGLTYRVDAAAYDHSAEDHIACALSYPDGTCARQGSRGEEPRVTVRAHRRRRRSFARPLPRDRRAHARTRAATTHTSSFAATADTVALRRARARGVARHPTTVLAGDTLDVHATTRLGYRISAVATRDHRLFLVAERPTDSPDLAQDILRSAVRFIRGLENQADCGGQPCWIAQGLDQISPRFANRAMCSPARNASA